MTRRAGKSGVFQTTTLIAVVVLVMVIFVLAGYFFVIPSSASPLRQKFREHRALWTQQAPAAFSYVVDPDCYCTAEMREQYAVIEENGAVAAHFEGPQGPAGDSRKRTPPAVLSIEGAFELVDRGIDAAGHIEVSYDESFGFPRDVTIYWSQIGADDYFGFQIHNFDVIEE